MDGGGTLTPLRATTIEDARVEARTHFRNDEEIVTEGMEILEIVFSEKVDTRGIVAELEAERSAQEKARREESERDQLAKLKAKYGG